MFKSFIPALLLVLLSGCNNEVQYRTITRLENFCSTDTAAVRGEFILQCIANANPKSDEEPEDWILQCKTMADQLHCPVTSMDVVQSSNGRGAWHTVSKKPATKQYDITVQSAPRR